MMLSPPAHSCRRPSYMNCSLVGVMFLGVGVGVGVGAGAGVGVGVLGWWFVVFNLLMTRG